MDAQNAFYSSEDGVLFNKSQTTLIQCPGGKAGSYTIPNSVTSIGDYAFVHCTRLTNVTIGTNVTSIGDSAFSECFSLTSVVLPNSVSSIGGNAFVDCTSLAAITADADNSFYTSVDGVLFNHSRTMLIQYPAGKAGSYVIPGSVTSIWSSAFSSCYSLTGVTIPNGVTSIPNWAFYWCHSLTNVTIPSSVTSIKGYAFDDCTSLTNITIPDSVTYIGLAAFKACSSLTRATVGNSVANMEDYAFNSCYSLTGVYFSGNAVNLGGSFVFTGDNNATVYYLPGTSGWGPTFGGRPTALWFLPNPLILNSGLGFGVKTNRFGFIISWATNIPVVVEACTNLASPTWSAISTNTLTKGSSYFSDPRWMNYPGRSYRIRSP